jgi:hypothetical protein
VWLKSSPSKSKVWPVAVASAWAEQSLTFCCARWRPRPKRRNASAATRRDADHVEAAVAQQKLEIRPTGLTFDLTAIAAYKSQRIPYRAFPASLFSYPSLVAFSGLLRIATAPWPKESIVKWNTLVEGISHAITEDNNEIKRGTRRVIIRRTLLTVYPIVIGVLLFSFAYALHKMFQYEDQTSRTVHMQMHAQEQAALARQMAAEADQRREQAKQELAKIQASTQTQSRQV